MKNNDKVESGIDLEAVKTAIVNGIEIKYGNQDGKVKCGDCKHKGQRHYGGREFNECNVIGDLVTLMDSCDAGELDQTNNQELDR